MFGWWKMGHPFMCVGKSNYAIQVRGIKEKCLFLVKYSQRGLFSVLLSVALLPSN